MPLVECVPNFSEGRDPSVISAIRDAIAATAGAHVLDVSSDASHHRTVITFVASLDAAVPAALAAMRVARDRIDLTKHQGEHPRIGATDVVPFIPLEGATMDDCIALARELGACAHRDLGVPVYLYERAATTPARENLADVRRGEFEGLREEVRTNPARHPDFGGPALHPTAGATAVGARPFLVAYNVYLGDKSNLPVAKAVARAIRGSSGGLRYVKALGMEVDGQAQVSMNLVDTDTTPLDRVYEAVTTEAAAHGVAPTWSELVGLVPERVMLEAGARHVQLRGFNTGMLLETRVREVVGGGETVDGFMSRVASADPTPGGGSVAAHAGALGAALAQMVAGLTMGKQMYAAVEEEMKHISRQAGTLRRALTQLVERDAASYAAVRAAHHLPKETAAEQAARANAIRTALIHAAEVPLESARTAVEVAALAAALAERGNSNAVSDACVAALMAEAACKAAVLNVRINVASLDDDGTERSATLASEARTLLDAAAMHVRLAEAAAERAMRPA
ncbi:glutamate formimidoyltransferase [Gemmatimonas sp.]|jgi:glutamate formiminotransferase/formiminotetrahydrofolate cyclodeaminase|uniref:glutamate formimidoyltransferase n=1 Tax=Gemmatimonas sp. TaxID=1962908 RepID=UPI0037C0FBD4